VKDFSSWPTVPQLYIDGEFQGGCDIIREMYARSSQAGGDKERGAPMWDRERPEVLNPLSEAGLREASSVR
jgi:hypothetical protein